MKRLLSTLGIALITCVAWAQNLPQGFGFQIGFAQPVLRLNSPETRYPSDSLVNTTTLNGFKVGLVYDATFVKGFGASIGVNYTFGQGNTQWQRQSTLSDYPQKRVRTTYNQVELFVDWQYKFEIAGGTYIILYSGPSIQCAVAMTDKVLERQLDGDISEKNIGRLLRAFLFRPKESVQTVFAVRHLVKRIKRARGLRRKEDMVYLLIFDIHFYKT